MSKPFNDMLNRFGNCEMNFLIKAACVSTSLTLIGCASFGQTQVDPRLKACIEYTVPAPPEKVMTQQRVFDLVADLKQNDTAKTNCGRRLITMLSH